MGFFFIDGLVVVFEQDFAVAQAILKHILISLPLTPACWDWLVTMTSMESVMFVCSAGDQSQGIIHSRQGLHH